MAALPTGIIRSASAAAMEMKGEETAVVAAAETEEHVQRILITIDNFSHKVSEMLDVGRAMFKDLAADFEDHLCRIQKERMGKWEEEIRELRARDVANEQTRAILHNRVVLP
ncbi:hypothetical protein ACQJBY_070667 [Aegilops geniculata]